MAKKINSEVKFTDEQFKIKIGTTDKKNPSSLYFEGETYITPLLNKSDYTEDLISLEKECRRTVKNVLSKEHNFKRDNCIFIFDVANERVKYGKKSYLSFQFMFKLNDDTPKNISFKEISERMATEYKGDLDLCKELIESYGFACSKTK